MMRKPRGGALLAALIVIGVISLVTVATLQLANISKQQAAKDSRSLSQVACVEAARQYMLSRLRLFGAPATAIKLDQAITVDNGKKRMVTGHVRPQGVTTDQPAITSVLPLQGSFVGGAKAGERSNVVGTGLGLGATAYRAVVACTDPQAGDMELEFTFQFGL
jgi:type II secretory pathway pseudopilin PulG